MKVLFILQLKFYNIFTILTLVRLFRIKFMTNKKKILIKKFKKNIRINNNNMQPLHNINKY